MGHDGKAKTKKGISKRTKAKKTQPSSYQASRSFGSQPKSELKTYDLAETLLPVSTSTSQSLLNGVANGADLYQRVGRKIYQKSLHIRGIVRPSANAGVAAQGGMRMIVYYDSNPNGSAPGLSDLLLDSNSGAAQTWLSNLNMGNRERFMILRDRVIYYPNATNANPGVITGAVPVTTQDNFVFNEFIKLKGIETVFNGTGGTISAINTGAIYVLFVGDSASNGAWSFDFQSRLRFYD